MHQDRDYSHVPIKRGGNFQPDEIIQVIQAASSAVCNREPVPADQRDQHITCADGFLNDLDEVRTWLNLFYVHEDLIFAKVGAEIVEKVERFPPRYRHDGS